MLGLRNEIGFKASVIAAAIVAQSLAASASGNEALQARIDAIAAESLKAGVAPGLSIAVMKNGRFLHAAGYGLADVENGVPATAESVFRIGSTTKMFTAVAIMQLAEAGKLSLDDDIRTYLPDYPAHDRAITIQQLLDHTSGIPNYTELEPPGSRETWRVHRGHDEMRSVFENEPLLFPSGESFYYTNSGFYLLGVIVEKISGDTYEQYLQSNVFEPAGLERTYYDRQAKIIPNRAKGYRKNEDVLLNAEPLSMTVPYSAGALCSTVGDLCRFYEALANGSLISPRTFEAMRTPSMLGDVTLNYCRGIMRSELGGIAKFCHPGEINGFSSQFAFYPEKDTAIAVLANTIGTFPEQIESRVARAVFDIETKPIEHAPLDDEAIAAYSGSYAFGHLAIEITPAGDSIAMAFPPRIEQPVPLVHLGGDTFCFPHDAEMDVTFSREGGAVTRVQFNAGIILVEGKRSER